MTMTTTDNLISTFRRRILPLALLAAGIAAHAQTANQPPTAQFTARQAPNTNAVQFDASGSADADGSIASYSWSFGDGSTGSGASPAHTYARPGKYSVKLTVADNGAAQASLTTTVTVDAPPLPNTSWKQYDGKLTIIFSAGGSTDPDGYIASYRWDFGDGTSGTGRDIGHGYAAPGDYNASLTATDNFGNTTTKSFVVTVAPPNQLPVARLAAAQVPNSLAIQFDGSASSDPDGTIAAWNWDFGDGTTGAGPRPLHSYAAAGKYAVKLTVTDSAAKPAQASASYAATVVAPPVPVPTWRQFEDQPIIIFNGSGSTSSLGHVVGYAWNFGDGSTGAGSDTSHGYAAPGDYTVTLTVADDIGNTASSNFVVTVKPRQNALPVPRATAAQVSGRLLVNFDAASSNDPDGSVTSWTWDFGDGGSATGMRASHAYAAPGQYAATLTVHDNLGASATLAVPVTVAPVNQAPLAWATASAASGTLGYAFDASGSGDSDGSIVSYAWDFGDGASASGIAASHTYAAAGQYRARLTVTDDKGAANTYTLVLTPGMNGPATPWVTGYYGGWGWNNYQPQYIDMSALTHVVFGRVVPGGAAHGGAAGAIVPLAGSAHLPNQLPPEVSNKSVEDFVVERAHAAGTRAILMLGGVGTGHGFLASTAPAARAAFIANLLDYLVAHRYDGVDVHWRDQIGDATSTGQLVAFLRELKQAAAQHPRFSAPNQPLLLTVPMYWLNTNTDATVPAWKVEVASLVDQFNVLTYEMSFAHGGWTTWHFSPIYGGAPDHPADVASTMRLYANAGIPPSRLGMGIGFYGSSFAPPVNAIDQTPTARSANDFEWSYANLVNGGFLSAGKYFWDAAAQASYRVYDGGFTGHAQYNSSTSGLLGYEDPASITAKGKWLRSAGYGGTMVWLINYGSPDGVNNPLLNAVKQSFLLGSTTPPPVARMSSVVGSGGDLTVAFDGRDSLDADNQPVASYSWDFGDGATATGAQVTHTYAAEGQYRVTLTVKDARNATDALSAVLNVVPPPPPDVMPELERIPAPPAGSRPWVTAYYAGWSWDASQDPRNVDYSAMTHLVFGRVAPGSGTLGGQPGEVVRGGGTSQTAKVIDGKTPEDYLVGRAHAAGVKALLMLGGVGDGNGFLRSSAPSVRPTFVKNLLDYLAEHDYDGIDVDWEDVLDTDLARFRLTALIADLRAGAKMRDRWSDGSFIITFPGYALNVNYDKVLPWKVTIASIVDQYNLMTYGMGYNASGWLTTTFAPLEGQIRDRPMDISSSMAAYEAAGVPRRKLGMGIGFYGMCYALPATEIDQKATAVDHYDHSWTYRKLVKGGFLSNGTYKWVDAARIGYISYGPNGYAAPTGGKTCGMVSFEDERSIKAKATWVKDPATAIGGVSIWVINHGSVDGVTNPLLQAVKESYMPTP